jgi:hypothetical protein
MKMKIDLKSALFGLLVGAAAMFTLGDAESSADNGRYQLAVSSGQTGKISIILDTRTGQAWNAHDDYTLNKDDGDKFWSPKNN